MSSPAGSFSPAMVAVIARKRKHIIQAFVTAHATSPETAQTLEQLGLPGSLLVYVQKLRGVLVEVEGGRYYLDTVREEQVARIRQRIALTIGALGIVVVLAIWYFSRG